MNSDALTAFADDARRDRKRLANAGNRTLLPLGELLDSHQRIQINLARRMAFHLQAITKSPRR